MLETSTIEPHDCITSIPIDTHYTPSLDTMFFAITIKYVFTSFEFKYSICVSYFWWWHKIILIIDDICQ